MKKINIIVIYITCLIVSNLAATKLIGTDVLNSTGGMLLFPVVYILGDVLSELYEYKEIKKIIKLGLYMNIFVTLFMILIMKLPYPTFYENQVAFETIFSTTPRIALAGFISYYIGSTVNAKIMNYLKNKDKETKLFKRMMLSTIAGEFLDGTLFITIAFLGIYDVTNIIKMIAIQVVFKTLYEFIIYPLSSRYIKKLKGNAYDKLYRAQ